MAFSWLQHLSDGWVVGIRRRRLMQPRPRTAPWAAGSGIPAVIQVLEPRRLLSTTVSLDGSGNLVVNGGPTADVLNITANNTTSKFEINDPDVVNVTGMIAGALGTGTNTVTVPYASVTGSNVIVNTHGDNDSVTVNTTGSSAIPKGLQINTGDGLNDSITIGSDATVTGSISLKAETVNLDADLDATGDINITVGGTGGPVDLDIMHTVAGANVFLLTTNDLVIDAAVSTKGTGNLTLQSYIGDVTLKAHVTTFATATLLAGESITDNGDGLVTADFLNFNAGKSIGIGTGTNERVHTAASHIGALAGTNDNFLGSYGIFLLEDKNVELGGSPSTQGLTSRAGSNTTIDVLADGPIDVTQVIRSTGDGELKLKSTTGNLKVWKGYASKAGGIASAGGNVTLEATGAMANVEVNAALGSDSGNITVTAEQNIKLGADIIASNANFSDAIITLDAKNGAITRTAGTLMGDFVSLEAGTAIGGPTGAARIQTSATSLGLSFLEAYAHNGGIFVTAANELWIGGASDDLAGLRTGGGNSDIEVRVTSGDLLIIETISNEGTPNDDRSGNVRLRATGDITQYDDGIIIANVLGAVSDNGSVELTNEFTSDVNQVIYFAGQANAAGQMVLFQDGGRTRKDSDGRSIDLTIDSVSAGGVFAGTVRGVSASYDIELLSQGILYLNQPLSAPISGFFVRLQSTGGSVEQSASGAIVTQYFSVQAATNIFLSAAANDVDLFAAMAGLGGLVQFNDPDGYTPGFVPGGDLIGDVDGVTP